jgi:protein-L-isoaspartate(D-aspartate) O-methyltransferase
MRTVKRHAFVPQAIRRSAYADEALPIGDSQTISQPWVVARMTELLMIRPGEKVLEVGTGSGYQAAVLSRMGAEVYTIEIIEALAERARATLESLGYQDIHFRVGDGYAGWPEAAPFDAVIITAAVDHVPEPLQEQLKVGGRLLLPLGSPSHVQYLTRFTRTDAGLKKERFRAVRFVPMTGKAEE